MRTVELAQSKVEIMPDISINSATRLPTLLFYDHQAEISGGEIVLLTLLESLLVSTRDCFRLVLICPKGPLLERARQLKGLEIQPIRPLEVGYTLKPWLILLYLWRIMLVCSNLAFFAWKYQARVIHANSIRSGLVVCLVAPLLRIKLIVHLHDALRQTWFDQLIRWLFSRLTWKLVAITSYVQEAISGGRPALAGKCVTIYNGIDLARFDPRHYRAEEERIRLLTEWAATRGYKKECWPLIALGGQITPWKGHLEALEALVKLRERFPQASLVVAGSTKFVQKSARYNNAQFKKQLDHFIQKKGLEEAVWFCGERTEMAALLAGVDLVILPSWVEPFGLVLVEAMALECPVVASAAGGPLEVICHGKNGLLFPAKSSLALAEAIEQLLLNPEDAYQMGKTARKTVESRFSKELMAEQFLELYNQAIIN
jgi:glycosyltransferase involved in cell wall biosynthesis